MTFKARKKVRFMLRELNFPMHQSLIKIVTLIIPQADVELHSPILAIRIQDRNFLNITNKDEVVLLVNNLGGVSVLELGGITNEVVEQLAKDWKIKPVRILSGTFMTSLNGLGFSVSLLKVTDTGLGAGSSMIELLDAPAEASGWSAAVSSETWSKQGHSGKQEDRAETEQDILYVNSVICVETASKRRSLNNNSQCVLNPDSLGLAYSWLFCLPFSERRESRFAVIVTFSVVGT